MRLTLFLGALGVPLLLAACKEMPVMPFNVARQAYPPDRSAWETISTSARAAHARSVHMALMTRVPDPVTWSAEGVSGTVTVLLTKEGSDTVCRGFSDRIEAGGHATEVTDIGCWADGWMYARQEAVSPSSSQRSPNPTASTPSNGEAHSRRWPNAPASTSPNWSA